jgi:hypothetical protein
MKIDWERVFKPIYWTQNYPTCWEWDALLNEIMDKAENINTDKICRVNIDGVEIWASNWPYAYGSPHILINDNNVLPSVKTRKRLKKMLVSSGLDDVKRAWSKA